MDSVSPDVQLDTRIRAHAFSNAVMSTPYWTPTLVLDFSANIQDGFLLPQRPARELYICHFPLLHKQLSFQRLTAELLQRHLCLLDLFRRSAVLF